MNANQFDVRIAASRGELDKLDPALLVKENFLYESVSFEGKVKKGDYHVWQEENGPIQNAARHGQLSYLPPEARTVRAMFYCGHFLRGDPKAVGAFEDAFYAAAMAGTLDKLPQDEQFKKDLLLYRDDVAASLKRAAKTNDFMHRSDHGLFGTAAMALTGKASEYQKRNAEAAAWMKDLNSREGGFVKPTNPNAAYEEYPTQPPDFDAKFRILEEPKGFRIEMQFRGGALPIVKWWGQAESTRWTESPIHYLDRNEAVERVADLQLAVADVDISPTRETLKMSRTERLHFTRKALEESRTQRTTTADVVTKQINMLDAEIARVERLATEKARGSSALPEVPSIPKDVVARAEAGAERSKGGK